MDFKQIQELIKLVGETNLGEVSIEQKDFKIVIKGREEHAPQVVTTVQPTMLPTVLPQQIPQQTLSAAAVPQTAATPTTPQASATDTAANLVTIKSPMIGTFYRRPSPDKPNFVEIGDDVAVGKVVCIIEAMKLFNEIESEVNGKVVKILVEDASPVEYDQPLFLVEPA